MLFATLLLMLKRST